MNFAKLAASALALSAAPALAQEAAPATTPAPAANAQVTVGATVYGPQGGTVGTIEQIGNGVAVVNTGAHKAPLPLTAFGQGETGPTITVTKVQLDGMVAEQMAKMVAARDAALNVGANVMTADGQELGSVQTIEGDNVVIDRAAGPITLTREQMAVGQQGGLIALFTAAQIAEATGTSATPAAAETETAPMSE